jgi:predicted regulator of Ras-like GTPase activity (Roadblock/LC7/MglB family)
MITQSVVSESTQNFLAIINDIQEHALVRTVVLCTSDGLPIHGQDTRINHIAAVAGFLLSSAKQSSGMLGSQECQEVTIEMSNNTILVCHPFMAGETELILTVLLEQKSAYKRLVTQTIGKIQEAVKE